MKRRLLVALLAITATGACHKDATGPGVGRVQLAPLAGNVQFGLASTELADPLQVVVNNAVDEKPAEGVTVTWTVKEGSATVTPVSSKTDARGIASARVRLGTQLGTYVVEASVSNQVGSAARFTAQAVLRPVITAVAPASAAAGQTVTVTGSNFQTQPDYNTVRFAGIRGRVLTASNSQLEVVVPTCIPSGTINVEVWLGSVASAPQPLSATGVSGTVLSLQRGQVSSFADPADLSCVRLPGGLSAARYLLVAQNASTVYSGDLPFELATYAGAGPITDIAANAAGTSTSASDFELRLRLRERASGWAEAAAELRATGAVAAQQAEPGIGDRRSFNVLTSDENFVSITAEIKAVSARAVLYQDLEAPIGGFTDADFAAFGQVFDDPIYDTDASVFGTPTDIDGNTRIIILFTPRVNALTKRGEASYVAGYFYGCDLVEKTRCSKTNRGEIFYSLVPDPQGKFSDARPATAVFRSVLPVLAHELQHMINFGQRDQSLDALWLSEALAHTAEDVVGDVFAARGDATTARDFQRSNYGRAGRFLAAMPNVSMIAEESPGTLELRGAGWLLLRYLRAQYGGNALLAKLTRTQLSSTQNVVAQTGQAWATILSNFGVALYASELAELNGLIDTRFTFGTLPVRAGVTAEMGSYPLTPVNVVPGAAVADELPSSGSNMILLSAPSNTTYAPINLVFSGARGGLFASYGKPQLTVLRVR